jgi:hypothetical protein
MRSDRRRGQCHEAGPRVLKDELGELLVEAADLSAGARMAVAQVTWSLLAEGDLRTAEAAGGADAARDACVRAVSAARSP